MANNWTKATVEPELPIKFISNPQLRMLAAAGFSHERSQSGAYFYVESDLSDFDEEGNEIGWLSVFQTIAAEAQIEIVIHGCWGCDRMKPGEFGGFVMRITPDGHVQDVSTGNLLASWRQVKPA